MASTQVQKDFVRQQEKNSLAKKKCAPLPTYLSASFVPPAYSWPKSSCFYERSIIGFYLQWLEFICKFIAAWFYAAMVFISVKLRKIRRLVMQMMISYWMVAKRIMATSETDNLGE